MDDAQRNERIGEETNSQCLVEEECEKSFKDEDNLQQHKDKMHEKFECDECEKVFGYESVLENHKETAHENAELFCHYFNNNKYCPFEDHCIFVHEESAWEL